MLNGRIAIGKMLPPLLGIVAGFLVGCISHGGYTICDMQAPALDLPVLPDATAQIAIEQEIPAGPSTPRLLAREDEADIAISDAEASPVAAEDAAAADALFAEDGDYRIHPFDTIRIDVLGEPDISGSHSVSSKGAIRHPLLDNVEVANLTVPELERKITDLLSEDYLVRPRVTVRVEESTSRRVTLLGEVKSPGTYATAPDQPLTLLRLIAIAGGFTDLAAVTRVRVIRRQGNGRERTEKVNVSDLLKGRGDHTDVELHPGDVVMVPEAIF